MVRCALLAALLIMALLQTSCTVTGLDILQMLLIKNDATPAKPLWEEKPAIAQTAAPSLPDLNTADPHSIMAAAR